MFFYLITFLLLPHLNYVYSQCVNINNNNSLSVLNTTYSKNCYDQIIQENNCCNYLLLDKTCKHDYKECVDNEVYILEEITNHCHEHNNEIFDLQFSDYCHNFTLHIEPYCCQDIYNFDCYSWYTNCHSFDKNNISKTCNIPTKYRNDYCSNYTKHIDDECCNDFTDTCIQIYEWCVKQHPETEDILDLFLGPKHGYTIGSNLQKHNDIFSLKKCAELCLKSTICKSFDYVYNLNMCYLNKHVIGDRVGNERVTLKIDPNINAVYYSKILNMPKKDTLCNVQRITFLGDGVCDKSGGYNTPECHYDGGDCCAETCNKNAFFFCGILKYDCIDPMVLNPPTNEPTWTPTLNPSLSPTIKPTNKPSKSPTSTPTSTPTPTPTSIPTSTPTDKPTSTPTNEPTYSPTLKPTILPTNHPTQSPTSTPTDNPTSTPTESPTIITTVKNYISKSSDDSSDDINIGLVIGLCLIGFLIIVSSIVLYKKRNTLSINLANENNTNLRDTSAMGFSNPLYDSNINTNKSYNESNKKSNSIMNNNFINNNENNENDNNDDIIYEDDETYKNYDDVSLDGDNSGTFEDIYDDPSYMIDKNISKNENIESINDDIDNYDNEYQLKDNKFNKQTNSNYSTVKKRKVVWRDEDDIKEFNTNKYDNEDIYLNEDSPNKR